MKIKLLSLLLLSVFFFSNQILQAENTEQLLRQLSQVNAEWNKQTDINSILQTPIVVPECYQDWIATHLLLVEKTLRTSDVSNLSVDQQKNRSRLLDELKKYYSAGAFPINDYLPYKAPVFIDRKGTHCAVGYLMQQSGSDELAQKINAAEKFAYVHDIKTTGVKEWADVNGFNVDELAWIQPTYAPYVSCRNDTFYIGKNTPAICSVFRNDFMTNPLCGPINNLTLNILNYPAFGTVTVLVQGNDTMLRYTPNTNYTGTDNMKYEVAWGDFSCGISRDTAAVTFRVTSQPGNYITYVPGDGDYNDRINNLDPLYVARNLGKKGDTVLSHNGNCSHNYSLPWDSTYSGFNAGSCDVDGNGVINDNDIDEMLNCLGPFEPTELSLMNSALYHLVVMPWDTLLTSGDKVDFNFIISDTAGNVVPCKALTLWLWQSSPKANLISTINNFKPFVRDSNSTYPKVYSVPGTSYGGYDHGFNLGAFGIINRNNLQNQSGGIIDSFHISGSFLVQDSIFSNGIMYLIMSPTAGIDTNNNLFFINGTNIKYRISTVSGVDRINDTQEINIYPNPAHENFVVKVNSSLHQNTQLEIFNTLGEKVYAAPVNKKQETINCNRFAAGVYVVKVSDGKRAYVQKLVVR